MDCIFCRIVKGEAPCHKIWEDDKHIAFLSIFPNTRGFTVVATKEHYPSYGFDVPESVLKGIVLAAKKVGKLLDKSLEDVGRTAMIMEGFGVNHLHVKLFPMHGTAKEEWEPIHSDVNLYFEKYQGYVCSNDSKRAPEAELAELAEKIRNSLKH